MPEARKAKINKKRRHFTLLELLVAAMAASVLLAALLTVLGAVWKLQSRAYEQQAFAAPRDAALRLLQGELMAAVPPTGILAGPLLAAAVASGNVRMDTLEFVTAMSGSNRVRAGGELVQLNYYLAEGAESGSYNLVRTEKRNLLAVTEEALDELVLLQDVTSFEMTFYDGTSWVDGWDSTVQNNRLPLGLHLRIEFTDNDAPEVRPLELILPFHMQTLAVAAAAGGPAP